MMIQRDCNVDESCHFFKAFDSIADEDDYADDADERFSKEFRRYKRQKFRNAWNSKTKSKEDLYKNINKSKERTEPKPENGRNKTGSNSDNERQRKEKL